MISVAQLNKGIRQLIEGQIPVVWVQGEISNFKAHTSGHFYFSLKDSASQIRAVMFRGANSRLKFKPHDGLEVVVRCRVSVYEPRGEYQLVCDSMEPVGAGALQKAYEQLKEKLKLEGLFDAARKRPLPAFPRHVAIVTSPTGAAIRDMMNVLNRRNRSVRVTLIPTLVQGEGSAAAICKAFEMAQRLPEVDVIIIGRGGGSIEDLWAFNDENLARLIFKSTIPVISAVGHEIDFTISDFVADVRAPTPSAAAELVVKSTEELGQRIVSLQRILTGTWQRLWKVETQRFFNLQKRLIDPRRRLQDFALKKDELSSRLQHAIKMQLERKGQKVLIYQARIKRPDQTVQRLRDKILKLSQRMEARENLLLSLWQRGLQTRAAKLDALSPLKVLDRGYAVAFQGETVIKSTQQVTVGASVRIQVADGDFNATVTNLTTRRLNHGL